GDLLGVTIFMPMGVLEAYEVLV
ncbi:hypothetical protein MELA_00926, partial [Candidatus Methylomirabilis lanthanidiphila]